MFGPKHIALYVAILIVIIAAVVIFLRYRRSNAA